MLGFMHGVSACGSFIAAVLFLRFWRDTGDRLFMWFAFAFAMFALNWTGLAVARPPDEARHLFYLVRLLGFVLILIAVVEKNRKRI